MHAEPVLCLPSGCRGVHDVAILHPQQVGTLNEERHLVVGSLYPTALHIDHLDEHVGHGVSRETQGIWLPCSRYFIACPVGCFAAQGSWLVVNVAVEDARALVTLQLSIHWLPVQEQACIVGIGKADHPHTVTVAVVPSVGSVGRGRIPLVPPWSPSILRPIAPTVQQRAANVADGFVAPQCSAIPPYRLTLSSKVKQASRAATGRPRAALTQIVDACPKELPEDVLFFAHGLPCCQVVTVLRAVDDALRVLRVVLVVAALGIVVAYHVDRLRISRLVRHHDARQGARRWARRVDAFHHLDQALGYVAYALGMRLLRLVSAIHGLRETAVAIEHGVRIGVIGIVHLVAD